MFLRTFLLLSVVAMMSGCGSGDDTKESKDPASTTDPAAASTTTAETESEAVPDPTEPAPPPAQETASAEEPHAEPAGGSKEPVEKTAEKNVAEKDQAKTAGDPGTPTVPGGNAPAIARAIPQANSELVDMNYVDSSFVAGVVVRPQQVMKSHLVTTALGAAFQADEVDDMMKDFRQSFGVPAADVRQIGVFMTKNSMSAMTGLAVHEDNTAVSAVQLKNQLKQIALAFHNYHDVNHEFPDANDGLSWRVHLLPYLEQQVLYEKFAMDEPWDSDTNKPLIAQMPDLFRAPGVDEAGKTSIHVFVGENAPFEEQLGFRDVIDGTSNTILTAIAGADTAAEWTKPGGLKINADNVWDSFGDLPNGPVNIGMMDGSVQALARDTDPETVMAMLTHAGREPIDRSAFGGGSSGPDPAQNPILIVHASSAIDKTVAVQMLGQGFDEPQEKKGNGQTYFDIGGYAIWFPNDRTLVATQTKLLPRLMANRADDSKLRRILKAHGDADVVAIADPEAMPALFAAMMEGAPVPAFAEITSVTQVLDVSSAKRPMLRTEVDVSNEQSAGGLMAMANGTLAMGKAQLSPANAPPGMAPFLETLQGMLADAEVQQDGKTLTFQVSKPANYEKLVDDMKPQFKELGEAVRSARSAARQMQERNRMKQIGIAFHNHHDVYRTFGAANGGTGDGRKPGLSWRVHLLPFLEEAALYEKFKRDEPWDSDHNKKLIAEMPEVYKVDGVEGVGRTSVHIFLGKGAPFGDGKTPISIRNFTDGTSNTILAVEAGADTAEVWTKPGGLEFDSENPMKVLGNIGQTFNAVFADGAVRSLSKDLDAEVLGNLIQHQDGNVVQGGF